MVRNTTIKSIVATLVAMLAMVFVAPALAANKSVKIPIYFVSDRRPPNMKVSDKPVDQVVAGQTITCGRIWVSQECPSEQIADPSLRQLEWQLPGDPKFNCGPVKEQFSQQNCMHMSFEASPGETDPFVSKEFREDFLEGFKTYMRDSGHHQFILFLHGCCCSLDDSFRYAAELAAATRTPVLMFDWASPGIVHAPLLPELNSYRRSERSLEISTHNFHEFMTVLSQEFEKRQCIVVAHSMGNRLLCSELLRSDYQTPAVFDQLHLVAADVSLPSFLLDQREICRSATTVYVYIDHHDPWLKNAQFLSAGFPRLGRPDSLLELTGKDNAAVEAPANRFFVDVSSLNPQHNMPYEVVAKMMRKRTPPAESDYNISSARPNLGAHLLVVTHHRAALPDGKEPERGKTDDEE